MADIVRAQADIRKNAIAFEFEGRKTSFVVVDINSNRVANGLMALGIKPNDRIAYLGKNSDTFFEVWFGAMKANAVLVPINWRLAAAEIAFIADDCKATVLFVGPEFVELTRGLKSGLSSVHTFITLAGGAPEWADFTVWRDEQSSDDPKLPPSEQNVAIQLYTSGTTGRPKGAMLSHANFVSNFASWRGTSQATERRWNVVAIDDVLLLPLPLFHMAGISVCMLNFYQGGEIIITREFSADKILDILETSRVTRVVLVPAAMQMMVRLPRAREMKFASLRYIFYGASPIPPALLKECIAAFNCSFVQVFGMTETTGAVTALPPEDHVEGLDRMRSAGRPLPGIELAILDADGKQLPPGEVGEIVARSGSNMVGYWNSPEATSQTIDADNWLHTGDAGYLDLDGYLYVYDRIKNMIISGGENIYPAEIESVICDHPDVVEAAVIGIPDETWGEAVKAVVVMKPGKTAEAADIIRFTRERIAFFKTPKSIDFIEALPRNASGKILHRDLRERYKIADTRDEYVLGHSEGEVQRLTLQADMLRPITERLMRNAGLREGMKVLDLGCGPGDVSMLAAELVGPSGVVVGIDRVGEVLRLAVERSKRAEYANIVFQEASLETFTEIGTFDLVIGRYVLIHQSDATSFVRAAAKFVRPGGALAFHELCLWKPTYPFPVPLYDKALGWLCKAVQSAFLGPEAADRLATHFLDADLPRPAMFSEMVVGCVESPLLLWLPDTLRSMMSVVTRLNIATEKEVGIDTLSERIRETALETKGLITGPLQVCGWARL